MQVRRARRGDLLAIGRLADEAHWDAYTGLLTPGTISALIRRDFSPGSLRRRLLAGNLLVAEESGHLLGFADAAVENDRVCLRALASDPEDRGRGIAGRLLTAVQHLAPDLPVAADVVLGCLPVESYLESQGSAPGEVLETDLFGEQVVERRWWLAPQ